MPTTQPAPTCPAPCPWHTPGCALGSLCPRCLDALAPYIAKSREASRLELLRPPNAEECADCGERTDRNCLACGARICPRCCYQHADETLCFTCRAPGWLDEAGS